MTALLHPGELLTLGVNVIVREDLPADEPVELAEQFGVARQTIDDVVRGRSWKHVQ